MKKLLLTIFLTMGICLTANAQTPEPTPCAENCVTISREAAIKAVETAKERDALVIQLKAEQKAFDDLRNELNEMRIKFAAVSGELSGVKQNDVSNRAIITVLLQSTKKQCKPFSICVF